MREHANITDIVLECLTCIVEVVSDPSSLCLCPRQETESCMPCPPGWYNISSDCHVNNVLLRQGTLSNRGGNAAVSWFIISIQVLVQVNGNGVMMLLLSDMTQALHAAANQCKNVEE